MLEIIKEGSKMGIEMGETNLYIMHSADDQ